MPQSGLSTERISTSLQQDILTLICHSDEYALMLRGSIPLDLYDAAYHEIAEKVYDFVDNYKTPPKDSLDTVLDSVGKTEESKEAVSSFIRAVAFTRDTISTEHVIDRVDAFVLHQEIRKGVYEAARCMGKGDTHGARRAMQQALDTHNQVADPGILLSDTSRALGYLDEPETAFPTGIKEFDEKRLGPKRKTLHVFVGTPKMGKSWWLVNLGRTAAETGYKVLHVTLEMSEKLVLKRYIQAFLAASNFREVPPHYRFEIGASGKMQLVRQDTVAEVSLRDREAIAAKLPKLIGVNNIYVKEFPTGMLTHSQLVGHLEFLSKVHHFEPDLLLVDYADLMYLDSDNYRLDLGKSYKDLRGLAVERNLAVATASQSNRQGVRATRVTEANLAEDFSKGATADTMITISKTEAERNRGLARLYVALAREDVDQFEVTISQSYATGQFIMDSALTREVDMSFDPDMDGETKSSPQETPTNDEPVF